MRIAYFTESLLPLVDGVSLTLRHLFDHLERRGIDFRVFSPFVPGDEISWAPRVRRLRSVRFPLNEGYRLSFPWGQGLARELDAWRPDLIHTASPTPTAAWAHRYAMRRGVPAVATFHTHFPSYGRYYGLKGLESVGWHLLRRFYRHCLAVFPPSPAVADELREHGIGPVHVWSRGVDTEAFSPSWRDPVIRREVGADDDTPLLLTVSRLVREKDLLDLPPMVRRLEAKGARFRLALVGDGPLRRRLEAALPHAYFAGYRTGEELSRWYASGDVFVFPSTTETFGNVVHEALASGVPAVVADIGGPRGVIEPGVTGLVARSKDPDHLAEQVGRLLSDPPLRSAFGRAARAGAERKSWASVNEELLQHYGRVLGRAAAEPAPRPGARQPRASGVHALTEQSLHRTGEG